MKLRFILLKHSDNNLLFIYNCLLSITTTKWALLSFFYTCTLSENQVGITPCTFWGSYCFQSLKRNQLKVERIILNSWNFQKRVLHLKKSLYNSHIYINIETTNTLHLLIPVNPHCTRVGLWTSFPKPIFVHRGIWWRLL